MGHAFRELFNRQGLIICLRFIFIFIIAHILWTKGCILLYVVRWSIHRFHRFQAHFNNVCCRIIINIENNVQFPVGGIMHQTNPNVQRRSDEQYLSWWIRAPFSILQMTQSCNKANRYETFEMGNFSSSR